MANHPPLFTSPTTDASGSLTEQAGVSGSLALDVASGTLAFADADLADVHFVGALALGTGYVGTFKLGPIVDSTGSGSGSVGWTFSVPDKAFDFLAAGQVLVQSYNVTVRDSHGGSAVQTVTVTLTGTNDAPVISPSISSGMVIEHAGSNGSTALDTATGTLAFSDPDLTDAHAVTVLPQGAGYIGSFTAQLASDSTGIMTGFPGAVIWSYAAPDGALDFLAAGQTLTQTYNIVIDDGHGGTATRAVTVKLAGTNDAPVLTTGAADAGGAVAEQADIAGSLTLDTASGKLAFTDADLADAHFVSVTPQGTGYLGSFKLGALADSTGSGSGSVGWTFSVADKALDFLAAGQTLAQSYNVTLRDSHGASASETVSVTLTGTNDAPTIGAATTNAFLAERAGLTGSTVLDTGTGKISFGDADLADAHTVSVLPQGAGYVGSFNAALTADTTGVKLAGSPGSVTWTYAAPDAALDFLSAGQSLVQSYNIVIDDGHGGTATRTVTVKLGGTNDVPVFTASAADASGTVTELAGHVGSAVLDTASGTLGFADPDLLDVHFVSAAPQGAGYLGNFKLGALADSTGSGAGSVGWTFSVADHALDFLGAGETLTQSYTVTVRDSHAATTVETVTVTLVGTNDAPVFTSGPANAHGSVAELPAVTGSVAVKAASGVLAFADADLTDTHTVDVVPEGAGYAGDFALGPLADSTGKGTGSFGWTYTVADHALDLLAEGQTVAQNYDVVMHDSAGATAVQTVTVLLTGTNDAPVFTSAIADASGAVGEQAGATGNAVLDVASGQLAFADPDLIDTHLVTAVPEGAGYLGSLVLGPITDSTGSGSGAVGWTYSVADNALDFLAEGQTLVQSYDVAVQDNHGATAVQTVTVTIVGTNDAPTITSGTADASGAILEQAAVTGSADAHVASGTLTFADPDLVDTHTISVVPEGAGYIGNFALDPLVDSTGSGSGAVGWSYSVPDHALDFLAEGQTLVQRYDVAVQDDHGASALQTVTVTLTGTNDAPVFTAAAADASGTVTERPGMTGESAPDAAAGKLGFADPDLLDTHVVSVRPEGTGYLGDFSVGPLTDSTGSGSGAVGWTYSVADNALDFLAAGQTLIQRYDVTVQDDHGANAMQTVTVKIVGTNDAPVAAAETVTTAVGTTEDLAGTLLANATDVDSPHGSLHIVAVDTSTLLNGVAQFFPGNLTYTPVNVGTDSFTYTIADDHGATSTATVTLHNDQVVDDKWEVSIGQTATFGAAAVLANDAAFDGGALTLTAVGGNATLHNGAITYTAPTTAGTDFFTYTARDSAGGEVNGTVTVLLDDTSKQGTFGNAANQAEWLVGTGHNSSTFVGSGGADRLIGGSDSDTLKGGPGADLLTGGAGQDKFVYTGFADSHIGAMDEITDFTSLTDHVELDGFKFTSTEQQNILNKDVTGFTSAAAANFFGGLAVRVEYGGGAAQVYVDADKDNNFDPTHDIVIHLDAITGHLARNDFTFSG